MELKIRGDAAGTTSGRNFCCIVLEVFREKFWRLGDKAAESGDVDYEYHHIIKGLYAHLSSWHIDPCREVRGDIIARQLILLPSLEVYLMLLISKLLLISDTSTFYGFECFSKKSFSVMIIRIFIIPR